MFIFITSNTNTNECESFWDDCDDSIFNEICDTEKIEKVKINENILSLEVDKVKNTQLLKENTMKRKHCISESNDLCPEGIEDRKKTMLKKLKNNSLFKC